MRNTLFTILLFLISNIIIAQKIDIKELNSIENKTKASLYNFINHRNGIYSVLLSNDKTLNIDYIDSTLEQKNIASTRISENMNILSVLIAEEKPAVIFSIYHTDKKINACYYSPIENISDNTKHILLSEINNVAPNNAGRFNFIISEDKNLFAIIKEHPFDRTKNEQLSVGVYSATDVKKIWTRDYTLEVMSRMYPINVYNLNNRGEVYAVKKEQDKTNYKYILYCFNKESSLSNARTFTLQGKYISDIIPTINKKGEFILAGFYSTYNYTDYEGYFIYRFNNSMQTIFRQVNTFGGAVLTNVLGKKAAAKEDASLSGFMLEHIAQRNDGGFYFMAEKHQVYKDKSGNDMVLDEDIFIFSTDADGNALGANLIKKKQETPKHNEKYTSFNYWLHNDSLNIIYNKINFDENALKQGKKSKTDEFGENNFAGTTWFYMNNKCEIKKNKVLTGLFKDVNIPMAVNIQLIKIFDNGHIILFSSDYLNTRYKYIIVINKE